MRCLKNMTLPVRQPSIILLGLLFAVSAAYGIEPASDWQARMEREIAKMREEAARLHTVGDKVWKTHNRRTEEGGRPVEDNKQAQTHAGPKNDTPKQEDSRPAGPDARRHASLAPQDHAEAHPSGEQNVPRDDAATILYITNAAEHGDAHAQCVLGTMYTLGQGVPKDDAKAARLFAEAAAQQHADAQYALGWMYANGRGVARDEVKAVQWCLKAADQGVGTHSSCQHLRHTAKRKGK
jgi:hypothetical protein